MRTYLTKCGKCTTCKNLDLGKKLSEYVAYCKLRWCWTNIEEDEGCNRWNISPAEDTEMYEKECIEERKRTAVSDSILPSKDRAIQDEVKEMSYCEKIKCGFNDGEKQCHFDAKTDAEQTDYIKEAIDVFGCTSIKRIIDEHKKKEINYELCGGCENLIPKEGRRSVGTCTVRNTPICKNPIGCNDFVAKETSNITEKVAKTEEPTIQPDTNLSFDYSQLDNETATYLQEKSSRITEIRIKSVIAIGKELKDVHDKLANHYQGNFGKWCQSIGMSDQTGLNYLNAYNYVSKNFGNIEDAEKIQPSVLFAISKPSAPQELKQAVLDGEIKTHKEYKALEAEYKAEQEARKSAEFRINMAESAAKQFEQQALSSKQVAQQKEQEANKVLEEKQNLEAESRVTDKVLRDTQNTVKMLQVELTNTRNELNAKPIEAKATEVVEVVPEDIQKELETLRAINSVEKLRHEVINLLKNSFSHFSATTLEIKACLKRLDGSYPIIEIEQFTSGCNSVVKEIESLVNKSNVSDLHNNCGNCANSNIDCIAEDDEGLTWCTAEDATVSIFHRCGRHTPIK